MYTFCDLNQTIADMTSVGTFQLVTWSVCLIKSA
nr:MAG TPA: hypothetical protein [Caudoviricetes sp.]